MSKKIFISSLFLYPRKVGGAENYFYNLLKGFSLKENIQLIVNKSIKNYDPIIEKYKKISVDVKINRGFYDYFLGFFIKDISRNNLIFSPNYITPIFPSKVKKITTIHDVQYLYYPEFFSFKKRVWLYISHLWTLNSADRIICISNSVKNDIIKFFGKHYEKKLEVINNSIDFSRFEKELDNRFIQDKYILSVAAQYPHKNLLTLIKAFNLISDKINYKLVLAGQLGKNLIGNYENYYNELNKEILKNEKNIIVTGYVSDKILGNLYKNCELFIFPSLFEGFGMPPIEAMGLGKPTITTTKASLKEVTLRKAIYLNNPKDYEKLAYLMQNVILNIEDYKERFEKIKVEIRNRYNPEIIARKYYNLFEEVMNEKTNN